MARPKRGEPVQRDVVLSLLPAAIANASGNGRLEFSLRQLFYAVRPGFNPVFGKELDYGYFSQIVADHETADGGIDGMYRDDRGALYVPHSGVWMPLGTRSVRDFTRPEWTFNKLIYIEKGGFGNLLQQSGWADRNDCAIAHSGGYASGAVRDLFDALGETDEPITFFCVHDADGYGTRIYQALVEETRARPGRDVEVINLGLEPHEAIEMGLPVESVDPDRRVPAADYLPQHWKDWLQTKRVELNAMTSPQFIGWLDSKLAEYDEGKVVPPSDVLASEVGGDLESIIRERADAAVREEVEFDRLVEEEFQRQWDELDLDDVEIEQYVRNFLTAQPSRRWTSAITSAAHLLANGDSLPANENEADA